MIHQCSNCANWGPATSDRFGMRLCTALDRHTYPQGQACRVSFTGRTPEENMPHWRQLDGPTPRRRMLDL